MRNKSIIVVVVAIICLNVCCIQLTITDVYGDARNVVYDGLYSKLYYEEYCEGNNTIHEMRVNENEVNYYQYSIEEQESLFLHQTTDMDIATNQKEEEGLFQNYISLAKDIFSMNDRGGRIIQSNIASYYYPDIEINKLRNNNVPMIDQNDNLNIYIATTADKGTILNINIEWFREGTLYKRIIICPDTNVKMPVIRGDALYEGTVSVKTKRAKSTGKSASALDREGNERYVKGDGSLDT